MVILAFADIFGKPGRRAVAAALPDLKARYCPDIILGNAENLAGGRGVNRKSFHEMMELGFHGLTGGNHTWDNKEIYSFIEQEQRILRPANFPSPETNPCPGRGFGIIRSGDKALFVINLLGRVFMDAVDDPFACVDKILKENPTDLPILVDMHCDATSEKYAMGWHLAGRVAAMIGSHSHVQTADERILPGGTAYITDVGMSGSFDSVIGLSRDEVVKRFVTKRPHHYQSARENPGVSCVVIRLGLDRKAQTIERLRFSVSLEGLDQERDME
jgi:2',3'-cyclic-nucleotide 2'-phosphodiesterase